MKYARATRLAPRPGRLAAIRRGASFLVLRGTMIGRTARWRSIGRQDWLTTTTLTRIEPVLNAVTLVAPIPVLAAALLASSVMMAAVSQAAADDATWLGTGSNDYSAGANWDTGGVPMGTASFGTSNITSLSITSASVGGWTFNAGASNYSFDVSGALAFGGAGIVINGGGATIINGGQSTFQGQATAGSATITNNNLLSFADSATAGTASITNNSGMIFGNYARAGSAVITNSGYVLFGDDATAGNAQLINTASGAVFQFLSQYPRTQQLTAGSIAGNGTFQLGGLELTVGSNNLSAEVTGVIADGGFGSFGATGASLVKIGSGTLTLSGTNSYTGATTVNGGTLAVNGSIAWSSGVTVNSGAILGGTGIVGDTRIASGGTLAPGNSIGTITVSGNLTFTTGSFYRVEVSPSAADRTNVMGTATLTGATVQATALPGSFRSQTYTLLNATGGLGGTQFAGLTVSGSFSPARNPHLTYDANDVYLVLDPGAIVLPNGASGNQTSVANSINRAVLGGATPPAGFDALLNMSGARLMNALTQISGETATGAQQSMFNAMTMFMGQLIDPFMSGRADMGGSAPGASSFAADDADAARRITARDAFAAIGPAATTSEQRWSLWAGGYGGTQTTDGNPVTGAGATTSRAFGSIGGADYRLSPDTLVGFALAGGGTSFGVADGGGGRSDLFQAGAFGHHELGAAYLCGALAYGWQDVTTDRTVTVAGVDRLQGRFRANTFAGRIEGGYRFTTAWMNLTPYAAGQVTTLRLPADAESVLSGANTFALSYGAKTVTATRSELGVRTDRSWAVADAVLTLRGRAAWAHDFNPDHAVAASFQTLPGASFVVNGAGQAPNAALASASAEMKWLNGWSVAATFDGEFSQATRSFAGKGMVRRQW